MLLASVDSQNGDFLWRVTLLQEVEGKSQDHLGLALVLLTLDQVLLLVVLVVVKEEAGIDPSDGPIQTDRRMAGQFGVDDVHHLFYFWPHSSLLGELGVRDLVVEEALEHREGKVVVLFQFMDLNLGFELLVIANKDQVFSVLRQSRDQVRLDYLCGLLNQDDGECRLAQNFCVLRSSSRGHGNDIRVLEDALRILVI
jgi:hypothetical protein